MEVKPGYKQTEVGWIPEEWEAQKLRDFVSLQRGHDLTERDRRPGHVPVMGSAGKNGYHDTALVKGPGVVLGRSGASFGQAHFCKTDFWPHNTALYVTDFQNNNRLFTFYLLRALDFSRYNSGGAQQSLNRNFIAPIPVPVPPPREQEAIARALSDADALIEFLEEVLTKKRHLKKGAMQELLQPKDAWKETTLFDLANGKKELFDDGDWIEAEHITGAGIRFVQTGNVGVGRFTEREAKKYIFDSSFQSLHCKEIREGDLLICRLADPAGRACVLPDIGEEKIVTSVDVTIFRPPASGANRVFLANLFSTDNWLRQVRDRSGGTTHKRISRRALGRIRIRLPSIGEQSEIAAILSDMGGEIDALIAKLGKARGIKQGIMQELLKGKTRLI
jgi:type I restriction enzyme S subunit